MEKFKIKGEFIALHQLFKALHLVPSGGEAKLIIQSGEVLVNDEVELRRGRKLRPGDVIKWDSHEIKID